MIQLRVRRSKKWQVLWLICNLHPCETRAGCCTTWIVGERIWAINLLTSSRIKWILLVTQYSSHRADYSGVLVLSCVLGSGLLQVAFYLAWDLVILPANFFWQSTGPCILHLAIKFHRRAKKQAFISVAWEVQRWLPWELNHPYFWFETWLTGKWPL